MDTPSLKSESNIKEVNSLAVFGDAISLFTFTEWRAYQAFRASEMEKLAPLVHRLFGTPTYFDSTSSGINPENIVVSPSVPGLMAAALI